MNAEMYQCEQCGRETDTPHIETYPGFRETVELAFCSDCTRGW